MFSRDWILETLAQLALWYWPIFFWDMHRVERQYRAFRASNRTGFFAIGVTRTGRIVITHQMAGDRPSEVDWTRHAPRAPWQWLDLARLSEAFDAFPGARLFPEIHLPPEADLPPARPLYLDPG